MAELNCSKQPRGGVQHMVNRGRSRQGWSDGSSSGSSAWRAKVVEVPTSGSILLFIKNRISGWFGARNVENQKNGGDAK